jgi:hypothetical protein
MPLAFVIHAMLPQGSRYGDVGSLIAGTFGVVISLSGGLVAILIASNANRMIESERQQRSLELVNERLTTGLQPILTLVRSLERLHGSFIYLDAHFRMPLIAQLTASGWEQRINDPLASAQRAMVSTYREEIGKYVIEIANAMDEISVNLDAGAVWRRQRRKAPQQLRHVWMEDGAESIDIYENIIDYAQLVRARGRLLMERIDNTTVGNVLSSRLMAEATKDANNEPFDNREVRDLIQLGAEIYMKPTGGRVANCGFAILIDILQAVPAPSDVLEVMKNAYHPMVGGHVIERSPLAQIARNQQSFFGLSLQDALQFVVSNRIRLGA